MKSHDNMSDGLAAALADLHTFFEDVQDTIDLALNHNLKPVMVDWEHIRSETHGLLDNVANALADEL